MSPHGMGETAALYAAVGTLCALFKDHPGLHAKSILIHENGTVEVAVIGENGALKSWAHAIPEHRIGSGLVPTTYGADEADVIEADHIKVTVRRPLSNAGGGHD